jgi:hypothetical protein
VTGLLANKVVIVAALGALLLSDDGSFITAQTIAVDGGVTFRP